jgi:hypothetical protein
MPDNLKIKQPEDPDKININQDWELEYWSKKFGVSKQRLINAVESVGVMVEDVRKYLSK